MMVTEEEVCEAFADMRQAATMRYNAACHLMAKKRALQEETHKLLVKYADNPKELGQNEATRDATIATMLKEHVDAESIAQQEFDEMSHNWELCNLELNRIDFLLKVAR